MGHCRLYLLLKAGEIHHALTGWGRAWADAPGDNLANMLTEEIILQSASLTLLLVALLVAIECWLLILINIYQNQSRTVEASFFCSLVTLANLRSWESSRSHWAGLFLDGVRRLGSSLLKGLRGCDFHVCLAERLSDIFSVTRLRNVWNVRNVWNFAMHLLRMWFGILHTFPKDWAEPRT